jgi:Cu/Ag efflux protein CusF
MIKITSILVVIAALVFIGGTAHSQDDDMAPEFKTIDGTVTAVDAAVSKVTVSAVNSVTFIVPLNAKIMRDTFDIRLSDLKAGDYVTVSYYDDADGKLQAQKITVEYGKGDDGGWQDTGY